MTKIKKANKSGGNQFTKASMPPVKRLFLFIKSIIFFRHKILLVVRQEALSFVSVVNLMPFLFFNLNTEGGAL